MPPAAGAGAGCGGGAPPGAPASEPAAPPAAPPPLAATAFRAAEKRYQLLLDQAGRGGRGRKRLVARATDLSAVLDLRAHCAGAAAAPLPPGVRCVEVGVDAAAFGCEGAAGRRAQQQPEQQQQLEQQQEQGQQRAPGRPARQRRRRAFVFDAHPGLVVFPAALPGGQQAALLEAALLSWPDPPARSNHAAAFPRGLPRLLAAAAAGLRSAEAPRKAASGGGGGGAYGGGGGGGGGERAASEARAAAGESAVAAGGGGGEGLAHTWGAAWAAGGAGPPAEELLRRLRWVTLGPAFDWGARAYEPRRPHTPLPPELRTLGVAFEAAARAALAAGGGGDGNSGGGDSSSSSNGDSSSGGGGGDGSSGGNGDSSSGSSNSSSGGGGCGGARPFAPDAALVNYYRPGDTLGGHVDNAEADMAAPIVTASLGLAAVFLIGGPRREDAPTALLLRSGDIVVLGGAARRCYHGVPRVLGELPLPGDLAAALDAADAADAGAAAAAAGGGGVEAGGGVGRLARAAARARRVNISVRCIS